jgi:hypothetical protein
MLSKSAIKIMDIKKAPEIIPGALIKNFYQCYNIPPQTDNTCPVT